MALKVLHNLKDGDGCVMHARDAACTKDRHQDEKQRGKGVAVINARVLVFRKQAFTSGSSLRVLLETRQSCSTITV